MTTNRTLPVLDAAQCGDTLVAVKTTVGVFHSVVPAPFTAEEVRQATGVVLDIRDRVIALA